MDARDELLLFLADQPENGIPVKSLPSQLLDPDLLQVIDGDDLIQFGNWRESHSLATGEYVSARIWYFGSWTGVNRRPIREWLGEILAKSDDEMDHVRLTSKGQVEASRLRLTKGGGGGTERGADVASVVQQISAVMLDDTGAKILHIVSDTSKSSDTKMREICGVDQRCVAHDSLEWAEMLDQRRPPCGTATAVSREWRRKRATH